MTISVSRALVENYANYYGTDVRFSEWRRLGANDKCANILNLCADLEHERIIEVGCGDGAILEHLASSGFGSQFTGLEISPSAVECLRRKSIPRVDVRLFDGGELPFSNRRFDLAILSCVLEHVEHPRQLIYEAVRVAQNIFIEVPLEDNWRLPKNFVFDRVGHINFYSQKTLRQLVQSCGVQLRGECLSHSSVECYVYRKGVFKGRATHLVKQTALTVAPRLASRLFTYHFALTGTKTETQHC